MLFTKPRKHLRARGLFGGGTFSETEKQAANKAADKPMIKNLNDMAREVHAANINWWQDPATGEPIERNRGELLMLIVSELAEAMEGERKDLMDDKLPHRKMAEVEMADAFIRILDFCGGFGIGLQGEAIDCFWVPPNKGEALLNICAHVTEGQLTDALHLISTYCTKHNYDLGGAIAEKLAFNRTRKDHTHEARQLAGGKKF